VRRSPSPTILLVDDNAKSRNVRAISLTTHGYDVETIADASENEAWRRGRYDLVLLSAGQRLQRDMAAWRQIQRDHPAQQFMMVTDFSLHLCPVFHDGREILRAQGPEELLERIAALLPAD
jgi:DNA-binding response OmpR family regulator